MKNSKPFYVTMLVLFVIYISIFMASKSGYYEYENRNKKELTEAKMRAFEEDVKAGRNVDIKNYFKNNDVNYENKITSIGNTFSSIISTGINKSLEKSFRVIEKLIE